MTTHRVFDELLTWVAGFGGPPADLAKYTLLNNYLLANGVRAREQGGVMILVQQLQLFSVEERP